MGKKQDPNSKAAKFRALSAETGIPVNVLMMRHYSGIPLDTPYIPRAKGEARAQAASARKGAVERGKTRYEGNPCSRCGGVVRYTKNTYCVVCEAKNRTKKANVVKPVIF